MVSGQGTQLQKSAEELPDIQVADPQTEEKTDEMEELPTLELQ